MADRDLHDVIVIGAGIVGYFTAYHLTKAGRSTLVIEQYPLPHTRGSSHGQSRTIRKAYGGQEYYTKMMTEAYRLWKQLQDESGITLYRKTGLLCIGSENDDYIDLSDKYLRKNAMPCEKLDSESFRSRFPMFSYPPNTEALIDKDGGILYANKALLALQKLVTTLGGRIKDKEKVESVLPGEIIYVVTDKGSYKTRSLVVAAGPWSPLLLKELGLNLPLKVLRVNVCYWKEKINGTYSVPNFPVFSQMKGVRGICVYGVPSDEYDGLVKFCLHDGFEVDPNKRDAVDDSSIVTELRDYVSEHLTGLEPNPVVTESCIYTTTPDEDYILDVHPSWNNIVIGAGFSGHGFKLAPVIGKILAEMTMKISPSFDLSHFRINRFIKSKL